MQDRLQKIKDSAEKRLYIYAINDITDYAGDIVCQVLLNSGADIHTDCTLQMIISYLERESFHLADKDYIMIALTEIDCGFNHLADMDDKVLKSEFARDYYEIMLHYLEGLIAVCAGH